MPPIHRILPHRNGTSQQDGSRSHSPESPKKKSLHQLEPELVSIGSSDYEPSEEDDSGSWADLAQTIKGIKWLVPGWVPYGMLTGIIAEPKVGKSGLVLWGLVRPVVTGCPWFNGLPGPSPGCALYCDTERSAAVNLARMEAWGLPVERIKTPFKDKHAVVDIDNDDHIRRIMDVVCRYQTRLIVVDSFRGAHGGDENNSKISKGLQRLGEVCERTNAACAVIHHTKKLAIGEDLTINSGRGSNAFLAAVRCQIAVDIPDPKPDRRSAWRRMQVLGENLGIAPQPVGFRYTAKGIEFGQAPPRTGKESGRGNAERWLTVRMAPGEWYAASQLTKEAKAAGLCPTGTLQKAREALGITQPVNVRKTAAGWMWRLPEHGEGCREEGP